MKGNEIILLAKNESKPNANILVYWVTRKEFIVCSNLTQIGDEITWDWGHYYTDLKSAMLKLYENEIYDTERKIINAMYNTMIPKIEEVESQSEMCKLYGAEEETEKQIKELFKNYYEE